MGIMRGLFVLPILAGLSTADLNYSSPNYPDVPFYGPQPNAPYMVDNTHNYYHVAPDKGKQNGPVWRYSGSFDNYMTNLRNNQTIRGGYKLIGARTLESREATQISAAKVAKCSSSSSYWLPQLASLGFAPLAGSGYKFYRNVADYGADCTGTTDASEAINAAIKDGNRCGEECGNTFTQAAIIYFPPGTYLVCTPIIQLYYTQFIGDALKPPTIQGCKNFSGIALIDTDPYIPGASGQEWFINQNQFLRQIRNFVFDLTLMPQSTDVDDQPLVPTGIHWQVAQGTSLQNLEFKMPNSTDSKKSTAVGIFTENGSGGFVSDLKFSGGNIGWRAGSQQYTARNLQFNGCLTAVQMVWDWGWTWQNVNINGGAIGFNISGQGGDTGQGIGSVSIIDSTISGVPVGVLTNSFATSPNIVLDNVQVTNVNTVVQVDKGNALLKTSGTIGLWTAGRVYNGSQGSYVTGNTKAPAKAKSLLDSTGKLFVRSRPQYENKGLGDFSVATKDGGCKNDGTGDQANCLTKFLADAVSKQKIAYFPAGIYQVGSTVLIPTGSRVQGASWSQIQGSGAYFSDIRNPKVIVQVGNRGEIGSVEIVEMLFSVRGNTAGAILMQWNTAARNPGDAAMWDSHFRVGGAKGTDLDSNTCPKGSFNDRCIAATLMFHVTKQASGYFENVWAWVADHDNDYNVYDEPDKLVNQISVYGARGMLIESQGPSWFYGTSSEHSVLYNYQISGAKEIYMGHIQTETPYYQPNPIAPAPFATDISAGFTNDPDFSKCNGNTSCAASWGLRVVDSKQITIHGAGLYSFFQDYLQYCVEDHNCQERILEVTDSYDVVIFNLFTVAISKVAVGINNTVLYQKDNQRGFTSEDSIWIPLPGQDNVNQVFVGTEVWTQPVVTCPARSCQLIFPTSSLSQPSTIQPGTLSTSFEYGTTSTVTTSGRTFVSFVTSTITTTLTIPSTVVTGMSFSNYNITSGSTTIVVLPSVNLPPLSVPLPNGAGGTTTRIVPIPPWPRILNGPTVSTFGPGPTGSADRTFYQGLTSVVTASGPTVTTVKFPATIPASTITCPPAEEIVFATPSVTFTTSCISTTVFTIAFSCPTTRVATFLGATTAQVGVDCSLITRWTTSSTSTTTSTTTTTPLPVYTTWPPAVIFPVTTSVDKPQPTGGGSKEPCILWFFNICIIRGTRTIIGGWLWQLPPGIYPPGPPPANILPPGISITGTLPPWPRITIGNDGQLTVESKPSNCKTQSATLCTTGYVYSVTTTNGTPKTTATQTSSDCGTVYGCEATGSTITTRTTTTRRCSATAQPKAFFAAGGVNNGSNKTQATNSTLVTNSTRSSRDLYKRADDCPNARAIVYPADPFNPSSLASYLARNNLQYERVSGRGFTAFYYVSNLPEQMLNELKSNNAIAAFAYYYVEYNTNYPVYPARMSHGLAGEERGKSINTTISKRNNIRKRAMTSFAQYWGPALVSLEPNKLWRDRNGNSVSPISTFADRYNYWYDDTAGEGAAVFTPADGGIWNNHPEFSAITGQINYLNTGSNYGYTGRLTDEFVKHGNAVAGMVIGTRLGICKRCKLFVSKQSPPPILPGQDNNPLILQPREYYIDDLLSAWDAIHSQSSPEKSVINLSWGSPFPSFHATLIETMYRILAAMDREGITIVVSSGNRGQGGNPVDTWPQLFANPNHLYIDALKKYDDVGYLPNLIVVGATTQYGEKGANSQAAPFVQVYASGVDVWVPDTSTQYGGNGGTSFAAPQVAALAAYLKQLNSIWKQSLNQANSQGPAAVKALIIKLQRMITSPIGNANLKVNSIWNGMTGNTNCLTQYPHGGDPGGVCKDLPDDIINGVCGGSADSSSGGGSGAKERRAGGAGGSCTIDSIGGAHTVGVTTGPTASPTCASSCGGFVCSDYWCSPNPTGKPPGYQDPKDPSSSGNVAPTTQVGSSSSTTTTPTPVNTYSTGAALAAYTTCVGAAGGGGCAWQWEIYTLPNPSATSFDGCNGKKAIFTTVTSVEPRPTDHTIVGPFKLGKFNSCIIRNTSPPDLTCDGNFVGKCRSCDQDGTCYGSDNHSCDTPYKGYRRDAYCYV